MAKMEKSAKDLKIEDLEQLVLDLQEEAKRLTRGQLSAEDKLAEEHKARMHERGKAQKTIVALKTMAERLTVQLDAARELRRVTQERRRRSLPKFVVISAVALGMFLVPYALLDLGVIGERLAFGIEAPLMMVIAWCYATIWERTRRSCDG